MSVSEAERYIATQDLFLQICSCYYMGDEYQPDRFASTSSLDWEALCWFARGHKIASDLHNKLTEIGVLKSLPEPERQFLEGAAFLDIDNSRTALAEVHAVQVLFQRSGVDVLWLKGTAMLVSGYFDLLGARSMADIDLLIPYEQLDKAVELLESQGYAFDLLMPRPIAAYFTSKHLPQLTNSRCGFAIEMHHRLFSPGTVQVDQIEPGRLLHDAPVVQYNGSKYRVPTAESMFMHVFIESQFVDNHEMSGVDCYKAMLDVVSLVRHAKTFSWHVIRESVRQARMESSLALFVMRIEQCVHPAAAQWEIARVPIGAQLSYNRYAKFHPALIAAFGTTYLHARSIKRIFESRREHKVLNAANRGNPEYAPLGIALFNKRWWAKRKYFWNKVVSGPNRK